MMTRRKKRLAFLQKNRRINRRIKRVAEICKKIIVDVLKTKRNFFMIFMIVVLIKYRNL